ncbi:MAG TPA: response regulator [Bryobacteraceae bacterium]|nr:response regulator [Bryobacteraceae bacterium]
MVLKFRITFLAVAAAMVCPAQDAARRENPGNPVGQCFVHDKSGHIWIGTTTGLFCYDRQSFASQTKPVEARVKTAARAVPATGGGLWWLLLFIPVGLGAYGGWRFWKWRLARAGSRHDEAVQLRTEEVAGERDRILEEKNSLAAQKEEIEKLLAEAREALVVKNEFLANISQEIRAPLNGILGTAELLLATDLTQQQRGYLESARTTADSLMALLNDVLDLTRIETGGLALDRVDFSLRQCMAEAFHGLDFRAREKRLALTWDMASDVPTYLVGDPVRLRQILVHLLGNAIDATERGRVSARVALESQHDKKVQLQFVVSGGGSGPTGLRLTVCSRLLGLMDGKIQVENHADKSTRVRFTTTLERGVQPPISDLQRMVSAIKEPDQAGPVHKLDVLLAESSGVGQHLAARILERRGHNVVLAENGKEALELLDFVEFDIILVDLNSPGTDGYGTTRAIREREKTRGTHTPIIGLTMFNVNAEQEKCIQAGMDGCLGKPIAPERLIGAVETAASRETPRL